MKPLIACFSHLCNLSYITGAEKLLLFLLRELSHHYTCILIVPAEGMLSRQAEALGIRCRVQPCPLFFEMVHPTAALCEQVERAKGQPEWQSITKLLHEIQPDYVFVNTSVHILPAIAAKELQIPVLWQITELIHNYPATEQAIQLIQRHADAVIGISDTTLTPFHTYQYPFSSFHYKLPPSWHMESLEPAAWSYYRESLRMKVGVQESTCLIGYISSAIYAHKGLEHFIQMGLALLSRYPAAHFLIAGEPYDQEYMDRCMKLVQYTGHMDRFHIMGFESKIQALYPAMDIVVIPSLGAEGFGMTALEGLVFGKPVVIYRSGGLSEIHAATGNVRYGAESGDMKELLRIVEGLILQPTERQLVGRHNARAAIEVYGIEAFRTRLHDLFYQFILKRKDLFQAIQGSSNLVYILDGEAYRPMRPDEQMRLHANPPRRVVDSVLQALPKHPYRTKREEAGGMLKKAPASSSKKLVKKNKKNRSRSSRSKASGNKLFVRKGKQATSKAKRTVRRSSSKSRPLMRSQRRSMKR
ncbi:glycosyltransferase family 4 protein [Paenibacillus sp. 1001270B_150601_E10]|uniref:glycosyltransferase family 4 protein n=1 Tax=Paenibacillus sp. 1001270B_150601_E10 TaxID=2787079 RepID=UPI00189D0F8C|nr:glycosyltransferase family 4 protein [Paenibacillus sp. 1001270B_150601_E10]